MTGFLLFGAAIASAQGPATADPTPAATGEPTAQPTPGPDCAECHLDVVEAWQTSAHALAYHDPDFQAAWTDLGETSECLACHTTDFVPRTGAYSTQGVACAACHGQTPALHPPEPVSVDPGVQVCANCHATTFTEWQHSAHGEQQLACTTCHTPHDQGLRFDTSDALCLNCHDEARIDYAHVSHSEQACVDCHWFRNLDETLHVMTGDLMPTGHDSQVETKTCVTCHADLAAEEAAQGAGVEGEAATTEVVVAQTIGKSSPLLAAQVRIAELETELQSARAETDNQAIIQLGQGLALGAILAGVLALGYILLRRQSHRPGK
jgi:hypothetical protein